MSSARLRVREAKDRLEIAYTENKKNIVELDENITAVAVIACTLP